MKDKIRKICIFILINIVIFMLVVPVPIYKIYSTFLDINIYTAYGASFNESMDKIVSSNVGTDVISSAQNLNVIHTISVEESKQLTLFEFGYYGAIATIFLVTIGILLLKFKKNQKVYGISFITSAVITLITVGTIIYLISTYMTY